MKRRKRRMKEGDVYFWLFLGYWVFVTTVIVSSVAYVSYVWNCIGEAP